MPILSREDVGRFPLCMTTSLTSGSAHLTLGIGRGFRIRCGFTPQTLPSFHAVFIPHRLWDGYTTGHPYHLTWMGKDMYQTETKVTEY